MYRALVGPPILLLTIVALIYLWVRELPVEVDQVWLDGPGVHVVCTDLGPPITVAEVRAAEAWWAERCWPEFMVVHRLCGGDEVPPPGEVWWTARGRDMEADHLDYARVFSHFDDDNLVGWSALVELDGMHQWGMPPRDMAATHAIGHVKGIADLHQAGHVMDGRWERSGIGDEGVDRCTE